MATGSLRTSPTLSLCVEAGEPPLHYRFLALTANFSTSIAQLSNLPIFSPALRHRLESHLQKRLKLNPLLPIFPSTPPWPTFPPDIRLDLTDLPKSSNSAYRKIIKNIISSDYPTPFSVSQMVLNLARKLDTSFISKVSSRTNVLKTRLQFLPLNYLLSSPVSLGFPSSPLLKFLY